jgi:hypothetical protein
LHLRDWLTADNAGSTTTREAAFALATRPVTAAIALRPPAESTADDRIAFNQAARVAAAVSRNLKIVADPARELPRDFTALAFPLLEQVAPVGTPGIAHDIVRVLQRFVPSDPKGHSLFWLPQSLARLTTSGKLTVRALSPTWSIRSSRSIVTASSVTRIGPVACGGS